MQLTRLRIMNCACAEQYAAWPPRWDLRFTMCVICFTPATRYGATVDAISDASKVAAVANKFAIRRETYT